MQVHFNASLVTISVDMVDSSSVETGRTANDAMDLSTKRMKQNGNEDDSKTKLWQVEHCQ